MSTEKERYLRWMEMEWERRVSDSREEQRVAKLLEAFGDLAEESGRLSEPPEYEPGRQRYGW